MNGCEALGHLWGPWTWLPRRVSGAFGAYRTCVRGTCTELEFRYDRPVEREDVVEVVG